MMFRMYGTTGNQMNKVPTGPGSPGQSLSKTLPGQECPGKEAAAGMCEAVAVVDMRADRHIFENLSARRWKVLKMPPYPGMDNELSCHPDIMLHHVGGVKIVYAPGISEAIIRWFKTNGFDMVEGKLRLKPDYPGDVGYNVARVGRFAFHNLKYTDPVLKAELEAQGTEFINVRQGYAACSVSAVGRLGMITADSGIAEAAEKVGIAVLLIEPEAGIQFPGGQAGSRYGFIGGATGLAGKGEWLISGDLGLLKATGSIRAFLEAHAVKPVILSEGVVCDIGKIMIIGMI